MPQTQIIPMTGLDGLHGTLISYDAQNADLVLQDGRHVTVPASLLQWKEDKSVFVSLGPQDLQETGSTFGAQIILPVAEEHLEVSKKQIQTGKVQVQLRTTTREETVNVPTFHEEVEVKHVTVGKFVEVPPQVRREGDSLIVPVLEEVLVVEKKLRLREEIWLTTRRSEKAQPQSVSLRKQEVNIERISDGKDSNKH